MAENKPLEPFNLKARYTVAWNGISIGRIMLIATEDAKSYSLSVDTKTSGIASAFSNEKRIAKADGQVTAKGYIPARYESKPQKEDSGRHTLLEYDATGKVKSRVQEPTDDPSWRPPVSPEELGTTPDSATGGLVLRRALYASLQDKFTAVSTKTYDGSRLAEMTLTPLKTQSRAQIMGNYVPVVNTLVTRKPINGYTPKELKKFKAGDPEIHLYFTSDEKFLPVRATIDAPFGQLSATLTSTN